jgi:two-component system, NarL family, nitrate/nitrite response regulator NarL
MLFANGYDQCSSSAISKAAQVETILISDNALFWMGLKQVLSGTQFEVSEVLSKAAFEDRSSLPSPSGSEPTLFIVDVEDCSAATVKLVRCLKTHCPDARIMMLADTFELDPVLVQPEAHVDGVCSKAIEPVVLIKSLELVMAGGSIFPMAMLRPMLGRSDNRSVPNLGSDTIITAAAASEPKAHSLSMREGEILRCLMEGAPNKLIARQFGVTEATVKVHVKAILRKTGMKNRTQAALWAASHVSSGPEDRLRRQ